MRLSSEFIRLPLQFDAQRLLDEVNQFSEYEWEHHPLKYDGNTALSLISKEGGSSNSTSGKMAATPALQKLPYVRQVMASFKTVIGRSRFMRLAPGDCVPAHSDTEFAWRHRVRIHVPIVTDPRIIFSSINIEQGSTVDVHMRAGEAWIFDNWRQHTVINHSDIRRIHLVIDTVGTAAFWDLAARGWNPETPFDDWQQQIVKIDYQAESDQPVEIEQYTARAVRSPDEIEDIKREFLYEIGYLYERAPYTYKEIELLLSRFCQDWRAYSLLYGDGGESISHYQHLANEIKKSLRPKLTNVQLKTNQVAAYDVLCKWLDAVIDSSAVNHVNKQVSIPASETASISDVEAATFIVSAPRAGGAMLFSTLCENRELWSIGDVMDAELTSLFASGDTELSDELTQNDANSSVKKTLLLVIKHRLCNSSGTELSSVQQRRIHFIDYTPANALRIRFFRQLFPQSRFIFLHRSPQANIASIIDAWESQRYVTHPVLPEWRGLAWSLPLIPNWRELDGRPLAEIAAIQWSSINQQIMNDLMAVAKTDFISIAYEQLLAQPAYELRKICEFIGVPFGPKMKQVETNGFPLSKYVLDQPAEGKWQRRESEINSVNNLYSETQKRIEAISRNHQE